MEALFSQIYVAGDFVQSAFRLLVLLLCMEVVGSVFGLIGNMRFK